MKSKRKNEAWDFGTAEAQPSRAPANGSVRPCDWHDGDTPLKPDETAGCQGCGCLLETKVCDCCKGEFLDYSARGSGDDIIRRPYVTTSGDLYCDRCGREHDRAEEEAQEDEGYYDVP